MSNQHFRNDLVVGSTRRIITAALTRAKSIFVSKCTSLYTYVKSIRRVAAFSDFCCEALVVSSNVKNTKIALLL